MFASRTESRARSLEIWPWTIFGPRLTDPEAKNDSCPGKEVVFDLQPGIAENHASRRGLCPPWVENLGTYEFKGRRIHWSIKSISYTIIVYILSLKWDEYFFYHLVIPLICRNWICWSFKETPKFCFWENILQLGKE